MELNKNCVIVGASGGIGSEIAKKISENNFNLFLIGRNKKKLSKLRDTIKGKNDLIRVEIETVDLTDKIEIMKIIKIIKKTMGPISIIINAAGVFYINPIEKISLKEIDDIFKINIIAPLIFCKEFSKDMKKRKWGRIVNIGSSSSYSGFKNSSVYCSTKHAILGLSRALFEELKDLNIRTYCISPGSTKTPMGKLSKEQNFETFIDARDIAEYVNFIIKFDSQAISEEVRLTRMKIE